MTPVGSTTVTIPGTSPVPDAPPAASTPSMVPAIAQAAVAAAEIAEPVLLPFNPLLLLMLTAIRAHYNATQTWPTPDQLNAALPAGWQTLQDTWAQWKPSGDGSIKAAA